MAKPWRYIWGYGRSASPVKSPLNIFEDAGLDKAAEAEARSILLNSGQACIATSRVYVHGDVLDKYSDKSKAAMKAQGTNPSIWRDPLDTQTARGPQANKQQTKAILRHFETAKSEGASIVVGGTREGDRGLFITPSIGTNARESSQIMQEEVFGPVICLDTFVDEAGALAKANASEMGLYASVTSDVNRALRFAKALDAGSIGVNCTSPMMTPDMPFGGLKASGEDKEFGSEGVNQWTEVKTVYFAIDK